MESRLVRMHSVNEQCARLRAVCPLAPSVYLVCGFAAGMSDTGCCYSPSSWHDCPGNKS